jgi:adenylate cyclase
MGFAATHFVNHAFGLVSFATMEAVRGWLGFWHRAPFWQLLLGAFVMHILASLAALYEHRRLRLPAWQWLQLGSGLLIPPLLALHYMGSRGVFQVLGLPAGYEFELQVIWPDYAWQQTWLLLVVWIHGCVGIHYWLRLRSWYRRARDLLVALAVLLPAAALAGFVAGGREFRAKALAEPEWIENLAASQGWPTDAAAFDFVYAGESLITFVFIGLVLCTLAARLVRHYWAERRNSIMVRYPGGRQVRVPTGTSLLEASRIAGIAHASVCGGRGRCSTCRVMIVDGAEAVAQPMPEEQRVLQRLAAPPEVRLACQARPTGNVTIRLMMPPSVGAVDAHRPVDTGHGVEREVTVLFADLRGFTRLSERRLPFDIVYVLNRYFQAMGTEIEAAGGHVDKFIGDGIMALFGLDGDAPSGGRQALMAVRRMDAALRRLNDDLASDLPEPLRMVIAVHHGTAIVGDMGFRRATSLTAIGDAVNVASRLEGIAKEADVPLVLSADLLSLVGIETLDLPVRTITIRGRREPLPVTLVDQLERLPVEGLDVATPTKQRVRAWQWPVGSWSK